MKWSIEDLFAPPGRAEEVTPEEVARRIEEIQSYWTESEREERKAGRYEPKPSWDSVKAREEFITVLSQYDKETACDDEEIERVLECQGYDHQKFRERKKSVPWWWPMYESDPTKKKELRK